MVGGKPPGNPDEMLENAGRLLSIVAELESQAGAVGAAKTAGSGGAIKRANAGSTADAARLRSAATELHGAASSLRSAATDLQHKQDAWERKVQTIAGQLKHEFERAKAMGS